MPQTTDTVTVAYGDGIGPEITAAVLGVLDAAGAGLRYDVVEVGEPVYLAGHSSGIAPESWETIRRNRVLLKGPITTPQGGGYKSLNVTIRKSLGMFANVRPTKAYAPFVTSAHPGIDIVIVRENEEDLYAGIEYQQTDEVAQALKIVSRPGTERITRYAFEYARAYGRRKVTCMTKDNIMKHTDGLFHRVFDEVAAEYPDIEAEHQIIDIGAARLAAQPERFDVIVTLNLYGDILSDIAGQIAGSVGLAGSANIGESVAMFEAVHGSAPDIAGRGVANPSGLLTAATQMLVHLGKADVAERVGNAWLCTLESGVHTADIYRPGLSRREVGTAEFAEAVAEHLGDTPGVLRPVKYEPHPISVSVPPRQKRTKKLVGVDVFVDWDSEGRDPAALGRNVMDATQQSSLTLKMITNRGVKVFPEGQPETFLSDHWWCRFAPPRDEPVTHRAVTALLDALNDAGIDTVKTENLYTFDGERGYSLGQGE